MLLKGKQFLEKKNRNHDMTGPSLFNFECPDVGSEVMR